MSPRALAVDDCVSSVEVQRKSRHAQSQLAEDKYRFGYGKSQSFSV
jgi:hypothetical protein